MLPRQRNAAMGAPAGLSGASRRCRSTLRPCASLAVPPGATLIARFFSRHASSSSWRARLRAAPTACCTTWIHFLASICLHRQVQMMEALAPVRHSLQAAEARAVVAAASQVGVQGQAASLAGLGVGGMAHLRARLQSTHIARVKRHSACARLMGGRGRLPGLLVLSGKARFREVPVHCSVRQRATTSDAACLRRTSVRTFCS